MVSGSWLYDVIFNILITYAFGQVESCFGSRFVVRQGCSASEQPHCDGDSAVYKEKDAFG